MALIGCLTSTEAHRVFLKKDSSSGHKLSNICCCKYETFKCPEVFNSEPMLIFIHTDQSQNDTTKPDDPIKILSNNMERASSAGKLVAIGFICAARG